MTMSLALNPISWMATDDGWVDAALAPEPRTLLEMVKSAGFDAVMAVVPDGMTPAGYARLVDEMGLGLAPGYVSGRANDPAGLTPPVIADVLAHTRQLAELGFTEAGLGVGIMMRGTPRTLRPAVGTDADPARIAGLIEVISRLSELMRAEGVRPSVHPHVGTWIETESEARTVLDALPAQEVGFLPDTGHLAWAGADVAGLVADYAQRIPFVHVKDCRTEVAAQGKDKGWSYQETVLHGLWAEPGRGSLDLTGILGNLPDTFDGALIVEVDRPDLEPYESAVASAAWMRSAFRFAS